MHDLNSDLGEGFGAWTLGDDLALLDQVTSANIACGFQAGDPATMQRVVQAAAARGEQIGAHPGLPDLQGFGRRARQLSARELTAVVTYQVGALIGVAMSQGHRVTHVKPHGAMNNMACEDAVMAAALSAQDMRDIGAYFATQKGASGVADESPVPAGSAHAGEKYWQVGEKVFRAGNAKAGVPACLACHGPVGRGNPGPAYPNVGGQHAAYTTARMNYFRAGSDKAKASSPAMVDIAKRLTDEEIQGLSTYVEGLHHAAPAKKAE